MTPKTPTPEPETETDVERAHRLGELHGELAPIVEGLLAKHSTGDVAFILRTILNDIDEGIAAALDRGASYEQLVGRMDRKPLEVCPFCTYMHEGPCVGSAPKAVG